MTMLALHSRAKKIAAMPFLGFSNVDEVIKTFADTERIRKMVYGDGKEIRLSVNTQEGQRDLVPGDWIMRDAEGYLHKLTALEVDRDYVVGGIYAEVVGDGQDGHVPMLPSEMVRVVQALAPVQVAPVAHHEIRHGSGDPMRFQPGSGVRDQLASRDDGTGSSSRMYSLIDDLEKESKERASREAATGVKDPETIRAAELERILSKSGDLTEEEEAFLDSFDAHDRQTPEAATARQTEAPNQPGPMDNGSDGQGPTPQV